MYWYTHRDKHTHTCAHTHTHTHRHTHTQAHTHQHTHIHTHTHTHTLPAEGILAGGVTSLGPIEYQYLNVEHMQHCIPSCVTYLCHKFGTKIFQLIRKTIQHFAGLSQVKLHESQRNC